MSYKYRPIRIGDTEYCNSKCNNDEVCRSECLQEMQDRRAKFEYCNSKCNNDKGCQSECLQEMQDRRAKFDAPKIRPGRYEYNIGGLYGFETHNPLLDYGRAGVIVTVKKPRH